MQVLTQLHSGPLVLLVAVALCSAVGCDRPEDAGDEHRVEERSGITRLPSEFTNLEILPVDITKAELKRHMKRITKSLGVKCDHCHRTDIRDYATDEKEEKVRAREMMRMVEQLNRDFFAQDGSSQATCFMCHRGEREPREARENGVSRQGGERS